MSLIKSLSVGDGDMFYIDHGSDNFTIIDCRLPVEAAERDAVLDELAMKASRNGIVRFISTHPDQDHLRGLEALDQRLAIPNFYCVKNAAVKEDPTSDFQYYCSLRDHPTKAFYIHKECSRKWMNQSDNERASAGINILWPDTSNDDFKDALQGAEAGDSPNNTSAVIKYSLNNGVTALWMGDLETEFMEAIDDEIDLPDVDLVFAPHHGRSSGKLPASWLEAMDPSIIVLGEAPSEYLQYYPDWDTITQNRAKDITFDCRTGRVDVYVSSPTYTVDHLYDADPVGGVEGRYIGSFDV